MYKNGGPEKLSELPMATKSVRTESILVPWGTLATLFVVYSLGPWFSEAEVIQLMRKLLENAHNNSLEECLTDTIWCLLNECIQFFQYHMVGLFAFSWWGTSKTGVLGHASPKPFLSTINDLISGSPKDFSACHWFQCFYSFKTFFREKVIGAQYKLLVSYKNILSLESEYSL